MGKPTSSLALWWPTLADSFSLFLKRTAIIFSHTSLSFALQEHVGTVNAVGRKWAVGDAQYEAGGLSGSSQNNQKQSVHQDITTSLISQVSCGSFSFSVVQKADYWSVHATPCLLNSAPSDVLSSSVGLDSGTTLYQYMFGPVAVYISCLQPFF